LLSGSNVVVVLHAVSAADAKSVRLEPGAQNVGRTRQLRMRIRREKHAAGAELLLKLDLKSVVVIVTRGRRIRAHIDVLRIRLQQISVGNRALPQQSRARRNGSVEGIG